MRRPFHFAEGLHLVRVARDGIWADGVATTRTTDGFCAVVTDGADARLSFTNEGRLEYIRAPLP